MSNTSEVEKLVHLHKNPINGHVTFGNRLFIPKNTDEEKETVKNALDKLQEVLAAERVEKKKVRSTAEWLPNLKRAKLIKRMGHVTQLGYKKGKEFLLLPEEALFLLETNRLELFLNGIPLSIEQAYVHLLGSETCSIKQYRVYQNLARQGFDVKNSQEYQKLVLEENSDSDETSLKKRLKLDKSGDMTINDPLCCYDLYSSDKKLTHKLKLQSADDELSNKNISTNNFSVITCFSENDSVAFYQLQPLKDSDINLATERISNTNK